MYVLVPSLTTEGDHFVWDQGPLDSIVDCGKSERVRQRARSPKGVCCGHYERCHRKSDTLQVRSDPFLGGSHVCGFAVLWTRCCSTCGVTDTHSHSAESHVSHDNCQLARRQQHCRPVHYQLPHLPQAVAQGGSQRSSTNCTGAERVSPVCRLCFSHLVALGRSQRPRGRLGRAWSAQQVQ